MLLILILLLVLLYTVLYCNVKLELFPYCRGLLSCLYCVPRKDEKQRGNKKTNIVNWMLDAGWIQNSVQYKSNPRG
jgi:hypothetical protein